MEAFLVGILCHLKSGLRNLVSQGWEVKVSSFVVSGWLREFEPDR